MPEKIYNPTYQIIKHKTIVRHRNNWFLLLSPPVVTKKQCDVNLFITI